MPVLLLGLVALTIALVMLVAGRTGLPWRPGGRAVAILALLVLPLGVTWGGVFHHLDRARSTDFCLSCHEMGPYGKSLRVAEADVLAAAHFQNRRIQREEACYTCHTSYTLFGDFAAKLNGVRHVLVHFTTDGIEAGDLELYEPYQNRDCLRCHDGARSFLESAGHQGLLHDLVSGGVSCLSCHGPAHRVEAVSDRARWDPEGARPRPMAR